MVNELEGSMVMKVVEMGEDGSKRACAGNSSLFDDNCRSFRPLALEVRLHLARVSSMNEVLLNVEVMHMNLDLSVSGTPTVQHIVELPAQCEPDGVGGKWSKKNKTLTVMLPLLAQQTREACKRLHALLIPTQQPSANEAPPELSEHNSAYKQGQLQQHQGSRDSPAECAGGVQANLWASVSLAHEGCQASEAAATTARELAAKLQAATAATAAVRISQKQLEAEAAARSLKVLKESAESAAAAEKDTLEVAVAAAASTINLKTLLHAANATSGVVEIGEAIPAVSADTAAKVQAAASAAAAAAAQARTSGATTAQDIARRLACLESKAQQDFKAAKEAQLEAERAAAERRAEVERQISAQRARERSEHKLIAAQRAREIEDKEQEERRTALKEASLRIERARLELSQQEFLAGNGAAGKNLIVTGDVLVAKAETLLKAAAVAHAMGNHDVYSSDLTSAVLGDLYPPQASLCRQLMLHALHNIQAFALHEPLPADVRQKLVEIATVQSAKMEEDLRVGGGGGGGRGGGGGGGGAAMGVQPDMMSGHAHAPMFHANEPLGAVEEEDGAAVKAEVVSPSHASVVQCEGMTEQLTKAEAANKAQRRTAKAVLKAAADLIADSLNAAGWAVCDHFAPPELVANVRRELAQLIPSYEPSEIWVGKEAGVGAQIVVPEVRGDKVMWMCGGHKTSGDAGMFDSNGLQPTARGAIEPCSEAVKKRLLAAGGATRVTPSLMHKFVSIKQLIKYIDQLVFDTLKGRVRKLQRVAERSDAMLAVYPGKGSRFQRHIDNTAGDGRVLTVLVYLNSDWDAADGGALRVYTPLNRSGSGACGSGGGDSSRSSPDSEATPPHRSLPHHLPAAAPCDVYPECGRVALFFADEVPHEVRPTKAKRHAMTIWYYDEELRKSAVSSAVQAQTSSLAGMTGTAGMRATGDAANPTAGPTVGLSAAAKTEASGFVRSVLAPSTWLGGGTRPSAKDVEAVATAAAALSPDALRVVAGICGAPSVEALSESLSLLSPDNLSDLRDRFRHMGV